MDSVVDANKIEDIMVNVPDDDDADSKYGKRFTFWSWEVLFAPNTGIDRHHACACVAVWLQYHL